MNAVLLIDFGSTNTKLTAVNIDDNEIIDTSVCLTTARTEIMDGFNGAFLKLQNKTKGLNINYIDKLACSSAAGGLKMISIGLIPSLTAEAAKRAALGAGSKVFKTFSHELNFHEINEIIEDKPDIILLAGGTDGGNKDCILHNAEMLSKYIRNIPIVVSGNKNAIDTIEKNFKVNNLYYKITQNVMPQLNVLNVNPARKAIRDIFMEKIIEAKGMKKVEKYINNILMPTPTAVLNAVHILADGTKEEEGIGDVMVVDVGGATTDVHSISHGLPSKSGVLLKGLQEPYAKRTVEGDLGMRESAWSLYEAAGLVKIKKFLNNNKVDIKNRCEFLSKNIDFIPKTTVDLNTDIALSCTAVEISIERHVGRIENEYSPMGVLYSQEGKDLSNTKYLIGTGGVIVNSNNPKKILESGLANIEDSKYLKPTNPEILIDKSYILSAMGLLSEKYPNRALKILKKYVVK